MFNEKAYDILKYIQRIALPAVAVLIAALGNALKWDCSIVVAIISSVDVFLGSLLQYDYDLYQIEKKEKEEDES